MNTHQDSFGYGLWTAQGEHPHQAAQVVHNTHRIISNPLPSLAELSEQSFKNLMGDFTEKIKNMINNEDITLDCHEISAATACLTNPASCNMGLLRSTVKDDIQIFYDLSPKFLALAASLRHAGDLCNAIDSGQVAAIDETSLQYLAIFRQVLFPRMSQLDLVLPDDGDIDGLGEAYVDRQA